MWCDSIAVDASCAANVSCAGDQNIKNADHAHANDTFNQAPWDAAVKEKQERWGFVNLPQLSIIDLNWHDYITYYWNLSIIHHFTPVEDDSQDVKTTSNVNMNHEYLSVLITEYFATPTFDQSAKMYDLKDVIQIATNMNHQNGIYFLVL